MSTDDFADRGTLTGPCGRQVLGDESATVDYAWETWGGSGRTTWYEWVAPFTGWVFFRSPAGDGVVPQLWTGPLVSGHPTLLGPATFYLGEHTCWAEVVEGQSYYVQVDLDYGGGPGPLFWQPLEDEPAHTVTGTAVYKATDPTSLIVGPNGYPQMLTDAIPSGSYGNVPNPMLEVDEFSVNHHGVPPGQDAEYLGMGLQWPVITALESTVATDEGGVEPPPDATILSIGWGMSGWFYSGLAQAYLSGTWIRGDGTFIKLGDDFKANGPVHPAATAMGGSTLGPDLPTTAEVLAGDYTLAVGVTFPRQGVSDEVGLDTLRLYVDWIADVGSPVPPWRCGAPPLRMRQRDDGARRYGRGGSSSIQASVRRYGRGTYA